MKLNGKKKIKKQEIKDHEMDDQILDKADHEKLLKCVGLELPKNEPSIKKQKRSEPSKHVSLFSLNQIDKSGGKSKLELQQLLKNVPQSDTTKRLKRKIKEVENSTNQLSAPLPKLVADRIQRKIEYKKTSEDVGKWDHIVQQNRKAPHLSFPLNQEPFHIKTVDEFFKPKSKFLTPLEKEMHALLSNNKCVERPDHDLSVMEEETLAAMSLEEARARLNELRKHRALLSYHEVKSKRQKKIKSRHYHKMLKKQRMKENSKLPPVEDDLEELDRQRAVERASLRHRKGSKWSKNCRIAAKSNEKLKFDLEEQRRKHIQLLEKQVHSDSDNDELKHAEEKKLTIDFFSALKPTEPVSMPSFAKDNPWLRSSSQCGVTKSDKKPSNELQHKVASLNAEKATSDVCVTGVVKNEYTSLKQWLNSNQSPTEQKNKNAETEKIKFKAAVSKLSKLGQEEMSDDDEKFDTQSLVMQTEDGLLEGGMQIDDDDETVKISSKTIKKPRPSKTSSNSSPYSKTDIDFSHVSAPNSISHHQPKGTEDDDEEGQILTIEEAFADDDVVAEFQTERHDIANKTSKGDDVDLDLPGWGSWGGSGTKKKKKIVKKSQGERRRDSNLGHVILNEKRDVYIAKHQVHALPYPFLNKEQFEGSIARPIGDTWNTPETFAAAIKPQVESSMGAIISPINSNELFTNQNKSDEKKRHRQNTFAKKLTV